MSKSGLYFPAPKSTSPSVGVSQSKRFVLAGGLPKYALGPRFSSKLLPAASLVLGNL